MLPNFACPISFSGCPTTRRCSRQYERDPQAALAAAGMTDAQIDAVLGGSDAVRSALEDELAGEPALRRLVTAPRMMTQGDGGPDDEDDDDDDGDEPEDG